MFDEPKDMFSGIDDTKSATPSQAMPQLTPPPAAPIAPPPSALPPAAAVAIPARHSRGGLIAILLLVAILIGGAGAFALYRFSQSVSPVPSDDAVAPVGFDAESEEEGKGNVSEDTDTGSILDTATQFLDSDGDGLENSRELELGTLVGKPDSDSDGLGDKEEVEVYKTNPLLADTDVDGFADGVEVRNGYNPAGDGKLYNVPTPSGASSSAPASTTTVPTTTTTAPAPTTPQPSSTPPAL